MKSCENCHNRFSSGQVLTSTWLGYSDIKCSKCGAVYEHTFLNRLLVALIIGVSFISVYFIGEYYNLGYFSILVVLFLSAILILLSIPLYKFRKIG